MSLKIIALSDTHCQHRKIRVPEGDVLIHAGDMLSRGNAREWEDFAPWWNEQTHPYKIIVAGNHDWILETNRDWALAGLKDTYYLEDSGVTIEGHEFWGSPWTKPFCNWAFNRDDDFRRERFNRISSNATVLITHGPPLGYLDRIGDNIIGDQQLAEATEYQVPPFHIFGHVHFCHGVSLRGGAEKGVVVNAAICDERYRPVNPPVVLHI